MSAAQTYFVPAQAPWSGLVRKGESIRIVDSFGQRSLLQFTQLATNQPMAPEMFKFTVPAGADLIEQ